MNAFIYKTTNLVNGKIYIGQHSNRNQSYFGSGVKLYSSIKHYGKHNFKREIIHDNITNQKALDALEKHYIKKFNSTNPEIGYNILPGTANRFGDINPASIEEVRKKISSSCMGRTISEHTRNAVSKRHKGTFLSDETKKLVSISKCGKKCSTDGVVNLYRNADIELPIGWCWGRLPYSVKRKKRVEKINYGMTSNMIWVTNEIENKLIRDIEDMPIGWRTGMRFIKRKINCKS